MFSLLEYMKYILVILQVYIKHHWNILPREAVKSPCLQIDTFKT